MIVRSFAAAAALASALLAGAVLACGVPPAESVPPPPAERVHALQLAGVDSLLARADAFVATVGAHPSDTAAIRAAFAATRRALKRVEPLGEYYAPESMRQLNGAPIDEYEEGEGPFPIRAEGFQVVEPLLWPTLTADTATLATEVRVARATAVRLRAVLAAFGFSDENVFDAARLELLRIFALGLSGYDAPLARGSIPEAAAALESLRATFREYGRDGRVPGVHRRVDERFASALAALAAETDLDRFDRLSFLVDRLIPLHVGIDELRRARGIGAPRDPSAWRRDVPTPYAADAFDPTFFSPRPGVAAGAELVALGRDLFADSSLAGDGRRACVSCHRPDRAFADGRARSAALGGGVLERNTPSVLGAALQVGSFQDARTAWLEDQARTVLANPREMASSSTLVAARLSGSPRWIGRFRAAFAASADSVAGDTLAAAQVERALAAYVRSLVGLDSRFDRYLRGDRAALDDAERRGFNVYMGKGKCGTCHFAPLFNGAVPPVYARTEVEVLGVPTAPDTLHARLDPDEGRFRVDGSPLHRYAFRTPGLRNVARTAPYMHNGAYATLEQVVDFYDRGGGAGIGIELEHQTLPPDRLRLTEEEKRDLIAFLKALDDGPRS